MALVGSNTIGATIQLNEQSTANTLGQGVTNAINASYTVTFTAGTGAGQADLIYASARTATATPDNVDLAGVLVTAFGTTITFARIKAIVVQNTHASASLTIGAGTNPWSTMLGATSTIKVGPGGEFSNSTNDATAWAVTAGTGDILKIDPGASTITYNLVLVGASV